VDEEEAERSAEDVWTEDYDEHIDGEEPKILKPKKKRHYGLIIALVVVLLILLVWTVLSPEVLPETGDSRAAWESDQYLGDYVGYRDIWAGNMTWGLAIRGPHNVAAGQSINISVLVTKIYEKPGNWFLQGAGISLKNVSVFMYNDTEETFLASMTGWSDSDLGPVAIITVEFDQPGTYDLYVYVKFLVNMDMQIGFLPLETVQINRAYLDVPIIVV